MPKLHATIIPSGKSTVFSTVVARPWEPGREQVFGWIGRSVLHHNILMAHLRSMTLNRLKQTLKTTNRAKVDGDERRIKGRWLGLSNHTPST